MEKPIRRCEEHGYFRGERCPRCDSEGTFILGREKTYRLGRVVSGSLRHFPDEIGIKVDASGWAGVDELFHALEKRYGWIKMRHLVGLIKSDEKGRYEMSGSKVRARYAHSINVNLDYPQNDLETLYYGTSEEEADMVLSAGLKPMKQRYVHLSKTYKKSVEAASAHTDRPIILKIDAGEAQKDGLKIMSATDEIALVEEIPPKYIKIVSADVA
ncbi:MAG: RNA 2'-phosphotransferase [Candidatus Methanolliviera hydrocarbonicum]|uniref:Probable RNA 2'-phosphotransferase n=1 Tax=Candidatus Methanolliviera hydrocarbonicum TaxID=2491085 RepID=A0A520KW75_9EURY|nr:MAG: RNA 2'-phosphotransferase [Candidatus Methanolliviera hydrocarbonicum]